MNTRAALKKAKTRARSVCTPFYTHYDQKSKAGALGSDAPDIPPENPLDQTIRTVQTPGASRARARLQPLLESPKTFAPHVTKKQSGEARIPFFGRNAGLRPAKKPFRLLTQENAARFVISLINVKGGWPPRAHGCPGWWCVAVGNIYWAQCTPRDAALWPA